MTASIQNVKLVVFDLDGTVADTAPDIQANVNMALQKWGLSPYSLEEVKSFVGHGAKVFAQRALRGRGSELRNKGISDNPEDPELLERFFADHMSFYKTNQNANTVLYDGVYSFLNSTPRPLALFTNKPGVPTMRLLAHFNILDCFKVILHADNVEKQKPHPFGLYQIMEQLQVPARYTLMVGDGTPDIEVAQKAGCRSVGLLQGNTKEPALRAMSPDWLVNTFQDFVDLLEN